MPLQKSCAFRQTHRFANSPQSIESESAAHNKQSSEPLYLNPAAFSLRCCFKMQASHKSHFLVRCLLLLNFIWNAVLPYSRQIWLRDEGEREREKRKEEQSEEWKLLCGSRAEEKAHCDWQMTQEQRDT